MGKDHVFADLRSEEIWHSGEIRQTLRTDPAQLAVQTQQLWDQSGFIAVQLAELVAMNAALRGASQGVARGRAPAALPSKT